MLRVYPEGFADKIKEMLPFVINGGEGKPLINLDESPQQCFEFLPWETWPEAKLLPPLRYMRGNKHLEVPQLWLDSFPVPFEILHKVESRARRERGPPQKRKPA